MGVDGQRDAPAALLPRKRGGIFRTEGVVVPRPVVDYCGKSRPHLDSILGPSSP